MDVHAQSMDVHAHLCMSMDSIVCSCTKKQIIHFKPSMDVHGQYMDITENFCTFSCGFEFVLLVSMDVHGQYMDSP